jgi:hypothetical protein
MSWHQVTANILELDNPRGEEPLCSGREMLLRQGEILGLKHFRAHLTVENLGPIRANGPFKIACRFYIKGKFKEWQPYLISEQDISTKTLFCAGFPYFSITGLDTDGVFITFSEIVELEPL